MSDGPAPEESQLPVPAKDSKQVEKLIEVAAPELARGMGKRRREELARLLAVGTTQVVVHSGPIPPAEELSRYDQVIPNGADRIMAMAEAQSKHRMEMEALVLTSQQQQSARGQH